MMNRYTVEKIRQPQQERLAYIDFRLYFLGSVGRNNLVVRFGLKEAAATRDIAKYKELAEENLDYDNKAKLYQVTKEFKPLFNYDAIKALDTLSQGVGDGQIAAGKPFISCEIPFQLQKPDIDVLSKLTRAIFNQRPISIQYRSVSSGLSEKVIIPFSLGNNGLRWHVRAFDRTKNRFADFVITRISNPSELSVNTVDEHEHKDADIQWNRIVELEVVAHPNIEYKETIENDYGMENGVLRINIRAAAAGYLLRCWNIDCTAKADLKGGEYHLWLKNRQALYGVDNAKLAPGFEKNPL